MKKNIFIITCLLITQFILAQAPGGVAGAARWYKADAGVTTGATMTWTDQSGNNVNVSQSVAANQPTYVNAGAFLINFNPQLTFLQASDQRLFNTTGGLAFGNGAHTTYVIAKSGGPLQPAYVVAFGTANSLNGFNVGIVSTSAISGGGPPTQVAKYPNLTWNNGDLHLVRTGFNGGITQPFYVSANGENEILSPNYTANITDLNFAIGSRSSAANNEWSGAISEVIIYPGKHTVADYNKVESYLALKWGTTKANNYIASNGTTTYWDATTNAGYTNNIAGIGRDNASGLHQRQSQSQNAGVQPVIGNNFTILATNTAGAGDFATDNNFMVWGSDSGSDKIETSFAFGTMNARMGKIWKIQETNTVGMVKVAIKKSDFFGTNQHLLVSNDNAFDGSDTMIPMIEETIGSVVYYTATVDYTNGQFFTFASYVIAPGDVLSNLVAWYKADTGLTATSWLDQYAYGYNLSRTSAPATSNSVNFNSVSSFAGLTDNKFENLATKANWPVGNLTPTTYYYVAKNNVAIANRAVFGIGDTAANTGFHSGQAATTGAIGTGGAPNFLLGTATATVVSPPNWDINQPNQGLNLVRTGFDGGGATGRNYIAAQGNTEVTNGSNVVPAYLNTAPFRIGSSGGNTVFWNGDVAEVIVYNGKHTQTDFDKVESYLAVKWGISKQGDYVASDGTIFYNNATYNNNIAGIGRDDVSGLNQKQSQSQNSVNQVIFGLGTVAATNTDNANTFTSDKQFLLWGDNGANGTVLFSDTAEPTIFSRLARTWFVDNSNNYFQDTQLLIPVALTTGFTIQKLMISSSDTFADGTNTYITLSATTTINSVSYYVVNLTAAQVQNDFYFTFPNNLSAPGGVLDNLALWLKANNGVIRTGNNISVWEDQSGNSRNFNHVNNPQYVASSFNFNPSISFNGTNQYFQRAGFAAGVFTQGEIFYSIKSNRAKTTANGFCTFGSGGISHYTWNDQNIYDGFGTTARKNWIPNWNIEELNIYNTMSKASKWTAWQNGTQKFNTATNTVGWHATPNIGWGNNTYFSGEIPEVILYNRELLINEKQRVNSYLGIKYGATLTHDYLSANSTIVWDRINNPSYSFNIFGIAEDLPSGLSQKVSKSINTGTILKTATTNDFSSINADANRTSLEDGQFVMFGDNNNTNNTLEVLNAVSCPALSDGMFRIQREWRVQETGTVGPIWIEVDISAYGLNSDIILYYGDNAGISGNSGTLPAHSFISGKAVFYVDFKDNGVQYFTIGGKVGAAACATCKGGKYTLRQGNSWNTAAKKINDDTGWFTFATDGESTALQAKNTVTYTTASNEWVDAWYPAPYGASALMPHRGNNSGASTLRVYTTELNRAAKVNFLLSGISEYYGSKVKVVVKGFCGAGQVNPIITPKVNNVRNGYTISGNTIIGNKYWQGLNIYSQVNVAFNKPVERIVIEYTIERTTPRFTHFWFTVGDMSIECDSPLEPNRDNVYIKQSFDNDNILACNDAEMKIHIINNNCNDRVINIESNTLPSGLEYVPNSYSGQSTPTYAGQSFSLNGLTIPSGETSMFIKVRSTNPASILAPTTYQTQSTYNLTVASGGTGETILSDNLSALAGLQTTNLTVNPGVAPAMPAVTIESDNIQDACGIINYTITIDNSTGTTLNNLQLYSFLNLGQIINGSVSLSSGLAGTIVPTPQNAETNFFIPDLSVPVGVHTITFQTEVTQIDEFALNYVELFFDPLSNECALSAKVVAELDKKCPTCEDGKGFFDMNLAWNQGGATARNNNEITNIVVGSPASGQLRADAKVTYPNTTTEWIPSAFPRWNGKWTELSRFDNLNGVAGKVIYEVKVKDANGVAISAKPSFQIAGMTKISGQEDIVSIKGYCGTEEVLPKLLYTYNNTPALNALYRRFVIDELNATATGTKPYYDTSNWSSMNVEFEKPVDRVVVEWSVNRTPVRKTLGFLYISDINLICENIPEPNADNVHIIASVMEGDLPTCEEATIKLNIKNWNCTSKDITLNNTLPDGLEYVADSYVGLGSETPAYGAQSFSLPNLTVPSGNSYVYIRVKTSNNTSVSYNTHFTYTVVGGTNNPNPYRSDDDSGMTGLQDVSVNYIASTPIDKPIIVKSVDKCFKTTTDGNGTELTYTITVNNPSASPVSNVELLEILDGGQEFVASSLVNPFGGTANDYATDTNMLYITGMTIPANTVNGLITFKVLTKDTAIDISNLVSMTVAPESECGSSNRVLSNELSVLICSFCVKDPASDTADSFGKVAITSQTKQANWPGNIPNGAIVLESSNKGFVITRLSNAQRDHASFVPVEGMLIYNTNDNCFQLYNGTSWKCIERACND